MSFKSVVILGGGPIGLMCAIEARQHFVNDVTIVEKRPTFTRTNVPQLQNEIVKHLTKDLGLKDKLWPNTFAGDSVPFSQLEEALWSKAENVGVAMLRPFVVESVEGKDKKKDGFYKSMRLRLKQWDSKEKHSPDGGKEIKLHSDLLIIASGGGAASDPIMDTLGFSHEKLKAKNYGAFGIFTPVVDYYQPNGPKFDSDLGKTVAPVTSQIVSGQIGFRTPDHNYLLVTLSHCTKADFNMLKQNGKKLEEVLIAVGKTTGTVVLNEIKQVEKNMAVFKIAIQRAKQFFSPRYPAVIVGDAAVTPHPEAGSGIGTGFKGFEEVRKLFEAMQKTHRSEDPKAIFLNFNDSYELHVSKKALEGTKIVLRNQKKLVQTYQADLRKSVQEGDHQIVKALANQWDTIATDIVKDIDRQFAQADGFLDHLEGHNGNLDWDATVGKLWKDINATYANIKEMTRNISLLNERLEDLEGKIKFS